jgi:hypothetical protein
MFFVSMPNTFKVGDTAERKINKEPARLTWRDANTLVIEPNAPRVIMTMTPDGELIHFTCGDAGDPRLGTVIPIDDSGSHMVLSPDEKRDDTILPGLPGGQSLKH